MHVFDFADDVVLQIQNPQALANRAQHVDLLDVELFFPPAFCRRRFSARLVKQHAVVTFIANNEGGERGVSAQEHG